MAYTGTFTIQDYNDAGASGLNTAVAILYKRSATSPTGPTTETIYTFETGEMTGQNNGWTRAIPASDGNPLWVVQAVASEIAPTATSAITSWSSPVKMVENGVDGAPGLPGDDGRGISGTTVHYQVSTSGTVTPTGTWLTTVPSVPENQFLWTRITITYTDSSTTSAYSVGKMGAQGTQGLTGDDGIGVTSTVVEYASHTSGTTAPTTGWQSTVPTVTAGNYLWTRVTMNYTEGTPTVAYSVSRVALDGVSAKLITLTTSAQVLNSPEGGGATTPATSTITGLVQNTAISTWTYSVNGGAFSTTLPTGVGRVGDTVTITGSTMTAQTISVRASDGTYSDTTTVAKLEDGVDGTSPIVGYLTNESHVVSAESNGTGYSLTNAGGTFKIYEGTTDKTTSSSFSGSTTKNGLAISIGASTGVYSLSGTWTTDNEFFDLTGIYGGVSVIKRYVISKSKVGIQGLTGPAGVDANLLPWVQEWDTNKTTVGSEYIITPKLFTGTTTPTFTGISLGVEPTTGDPSNDIRGFSENVQRYIINENRFELGTIGNTAGFSAETLGPGLEGESIRIWAGINYNNRHDAPFRVTQNGHLYARGADISGVVTITSGSSGFSNFTDSPDFDAYAEKSALNTLSSNVDTVSDNLTGVSNDVTDHTTKLNEIDSYIKFINGEIHLGNAESQIVLKITNDELGFFQGLGDSSVRVAYFSNNVLHVEEGDFITSVQIGNFQFTPDKVSGNLSFKKVT